jgi:hypothetical protein
MLCFDDAALVIFQVPQLFSFVLDCFLLQNELVLARLNQFSAEPIIYVTENVFEGDVKLLEDLVENSFLQARFELLKEEVVPDTHGVVFELRAEEVFDATEDLLWHNFVLERLVEGHQPVINLRELLG